MKFATFYILSTFCVLYAKSDAVTEFKAIADEAVQQIVDYEHQFFSLMIVLVSNLKDASTDSLGESYYATFVLIDILNRKAETKENKDCIASEKKKLSEVINGVAFILDECEQNSTAIGRSVRKKIQDAHKMSMGIQKDLDMLRNTCSANTDKPEVECISLRVTELEASLKGVVDKMQTYEIEAATIKPRILSDAMHCNAKVLIKVHEAVTNIQEKLQKCI